MTEGRPVPITAAGAGVVTHCIMCGLPYRVHDWSEDNWLACPAELCEKLKSVSWPVQGQSTAPNNLFDWLFADNRYPQHRGRQAAITLIAELWWNTRNSVPEEDGNG